jgi:hypothetical protein
MLGIMDDVGYVQKGTKKVNNQYTFVSHDAVMAAVRPALIKHRVHLIPDVVESTQDGNRTTVKVVLKFINADTPEDYFAIASIGYRQGD